MCMVRARARARTRVCVCVCTRTHLICIYTRNCVCDIIVFMHDHKIYIFKKKYDNLFLLEFVIFGKRFIFGLFMK